MIISYHCTRDSALLLLTCHPYIPFHFMNYLFHYIVFSGSSHRYLTLRDLGILLGLRGRVVNICQGVEPYTGKFHSIDMNVCCSAYVYMRTGMQSMACVPGCVVNSMCAMAADRVETGDHALKGICDRWCACGELEILLVVKKHIPRHWTP